MTNAILLGKSDAGNPHNRFGKGEGVLVKTRRESLLCKMAVRHVGIIGCVFLGGLAARAEFPADATRLRYVESNGKTYIDTGYVPKNTDNVRMIFRLWSLEGYPSGLFDARDNVMSGKHYSAMLPDYRHTLRVGRCTSNESFSWTDSSLEQSVDYDLQCNFDEGVVRLNGEVCVSHIGAGKNPAETTMDHTLCVLAYRDSGTPKGFLRARLYGFEVKDRFGAAKVNLVPCRLASGEVGMYDLVNGRFCGSCVDGEDFTAGPAEVAIAIHSYDQATGQVTLQVSKPLDHCYSVYAAYGKKDAGGISIDDWTNCQYVGDFEAGTTTAVADIPNAIDIGSDVVRFFLVDCLGTWEGRPARSIRSKERTQWIDTGIAPDSTTTTRMSVRIYKAKDTDYNCQFGVANKYFMFRNTKALFYSWFAAYLSVPLETDIRDDAIHSLQFGPEGGFVDGTQYVPAQAASGSTDLTLTLFGRRDNATSVGKLDDCAIYSATIEKGGSLERDFRPCIKDGVAGLYDNAHHLFYPNDGDGAFTVEELPPASEICIGVSEPLCVERSVRTLSVNSFDCETGAYVLTISAGDETKCLYLQHSDRGAGGTDETWDDATFLAEIAPNETVCSGTLPQDCLRQGAIRFVLGAYVPARMRTAPAKAVESISPSVLMAPAMTVDIDPETLAVSVRLAGSHSDGRIIAAIDTADRGTELANWSRGVDLGVVESGSDVFEATLPAEWLSAKSKHVRVFYAAATTHCPYDYAVESIASDATQWIDTGIAPDQTTTTELTAELFKVPQSAYNPQFGIADVYFMFRNSEPKLYYSWFAPFTFAAFQTDIRDAQVHTLKFGPDGGFVDGEQILSAMPDSTAWTPLTVTLFARRKSDTVVEKMDKCAIRAAKITKRGNVVRDFVPCVSKGEVGLYDRVTGRFFSNDNTEGNAFTSGAQLLGGLKIEPCDVLGCSDVCKVRKGSVLTIR